jgi:NADPH:quinone reductase-like Zn-dependent oxidoreductase
VLELLAAGAIAPRSRPRYPLTDAAVRHAESGGVAGKVILVP